MTKARQKYTGTFHIDFYSEVDEVRYQGDFTVKKLNINQISAMGVRKAQLNGGMYFDPDRPGQGVDLITDEFNSIIAHLELSIIKAPKWWDFTSITDSEILSVVFEEVTKFESSFRNRGRNSSTEANGSVGGEQEGSKATEAGANGTGGDRTLVGEEILSALEP